jgi:hypothetical protein
MSVKLILSALPGVGVGVVDGVGVGVSVDVGMGVLSGGGVFMQPDKTATAKIMKKTFCIVVKTNLQ